MHISQTWRPPLTFQSRNTSRARIRTPARTATSMIHQGTPVCCATVGSGDTVNITCNHHPNKKGKKCVIQLYTEGSLRTCIWNLEVFSRCKIYLFIHSILCSAYISVRSSQNDVFSLTVEDEWSLHNDVQVWKRSIILHAKDINCVK